MTLPSPLCSAAALSLLLAAAGCARNGRAGGPAAEPPAFDSLRYSQGGCFGTCPVFTLRLTGHGQATYDGKQYTRFRGEHLGRVGGDTLALIRTRASTVLAQAATLPREIESGVADASRRTVTLYDGGEAYAFAGDVSFPEPVSELLEALSPVAAREDWTRAPGTPAPPPSELIAVLGEGADVGDLRAEFYRQRLAIVDTLAADPPTYRMSFDPYTMTAGEMLRDLGSHPDVTEVRLPAND